MKLQVLHHTVMAPPNSKGQGNAEYEGFEEYRKTRMADHVLFTLTRFFSCSGASKEKKKYIKNRKNRKRTQFKITNVH